jgi:hypothetical protein
MGWAKGLELAKVAPPHGIEVAASLWRPLRPPRPLTRPSCLSVQEDLNDPVTLGGGG